MEKRYCIEDKDVLRYADGYFKVMKMAKTLSRVKGTVHVWSLDKQRIIRTYRWGKRVCDM